MTLVPARRPCGSCPYRRDVPSGVWDETEYAKLPEYDLETAYQPPGAFFCHQQDGRLCAGWVAVHDMDNCLGIRLLLSLRRDVTDEERNSIIDYSTDVPLFDSGAEAAAHGQRDLLRPGGDAVRIIGRLTRKIDRELD